MKIVRVFINDAHIDMAHVNGIGQVPGWEQVPTAISLRGTGFLADNSRVSLDIQPTLEEQRRLLALLDEIAARVAAKD